jgi:poly-gamma-glutamate synthesis protein (capsule biosynthesis protein)
MTTRPFASSTEPDFLSVVERLRAADITYGHIETNFARFDEVGPPARSEQIGTYFISDPAIARELRWAGIEIASTANNHSFDWAIPGVMSTLRHCDEAGIAHSGTGRDLEEAREPAYLDAAPGRVALVTVASGNRPNEWATLPKASQAGRPGVNPLRVVTRHHVDEHAAAELRRIGTAFGLLSEAPKPGGPAHGLLAFAEEGDFGLAIPHNGANLFRPDDHFEITSACDPRDLEGNLGSIAEARLMADLVLVAHHFSASEGPRGNTPPQFVRDFAHAAIDAGAHIFIGHGWHRTLGIEIYRGRPIFYGIGNFFAQSEFVRRVPFDGYESWGHDIDRLPTLNPSIYPLHPGINGPAAETWFSSALIELDFADREVQEIRLIPVEMGREISPEAPVRRAVGSGPHELTDGRPFIATGHDAEVILERYRSLSGEMGTTVEIDGEVGVVRPRATAATGSTESLVAG